MPWRPDFRDPPKAEEQWYDPAYDRILIEQSIAKQYGVLPSAQEELKYSDWAKLVGGLMHDTPLGQVVGIRAETDRDVLKRMSAHQKRLRAEWAAFKAAKAAEDPEPAERMRRLEAMLSGLFGR